MIWSSNTRLPLVALLVWIATTAMAQQTLTLDSCRALALRNNKQVNVALLKKQMARDNRKAAKAKYLPHVDVVGGYELTSKEISILSNDTKLALSNMGSALAGQLSSGTQQMISQMVGQGLVTPEAAQVLGQITGGALPQIEQAGNALGQKIRDEFKTDTRQVFTASVLVRQPIYMGGAITAANRLAAIAELIADDNLALTMQNTAYDIDNTYWTVVSMKHKQRLAKSYLDLVRQLNVDVHKMIDQGVATKADGLKVDVAVNEAEMQLMQVDNGLSLAKMLLCQLCGLDVNDSITLADEDCKVVAETVEVPVADMREVVQQRHDLRMLHEAIDISEQSTNLLRAANRPQVALTAGYMVTNPSLYNGFERKFSGIWNIGVMMRVPVWDWQEGHYKVRAGKTATRMAMMEYDEACEKVELQVNQNAFKVAESKKQLLMATKNIDRADENLRCANLGFKEGVMEVTDVMAAQTAWLKACSQKIDAEIDVLLNTLRLKKALGTTIY